MKNFYALLRKNLVEKWTKKTWLLNKRGTIKNTVISTAMLVLKMGRCSNVIDLLWDNLGIMQILHLLMYEFTLEKHWVNAKNCTCLG